MRKKLLIVAGFLVVLGIAAFIYFNRTEESGEFEAASVTTDVKAYPADSFVESFGLNTHFSYADYNTNSYFTDVYTSVVKPKLKELGVRYIRDSHGTMGTGNNSFKRYAERLSELSNPTDGSAPIAVNLIVSNSTTSTAFPGNKCFQVKNKLLLQGGTIPSGCGEEVGQTVTAAVKIAAFEGPNEPDHCFSWRPECQISGTWYDKITNRNPTWIEDTISAMRSLYDGLNADPLTQSIPILSPSYVHLEEFSTAKKTNPDGTTTDVSTELAKLDVIKPLVDTGSFHPYCTGKAQSSCLGPKVQVWQAYLPGKKLTATELGWPAATPIQTGLVSETQQAKYLPRSLFTHFTTSVDAQGLSAIDKSYNYELLDEVSQSDTKQKNFGIVRANGTPKPAFTAIKNIISLLKDPGSGFTTGNLNYSLANSSTTLRHVLFQKRDKSFWLVAYNDVASSTDTDSIVPATLQLGTMSDVTVYSQDNVSPVASYTKTQSVALSIPDKIVLIKIVPSVVEEPPPSISMHVGDIDSSTSAVQRNGRWSGSVTVTAHDQNEVALSGVVVRGTWTGGYSGTTSCTTINGKCVMSFPTIKKTSVTLTVTSLSKSGYVYQSVSNHDPDGSSNGTVITVRKPN